jgi:hypothetical protein
LINKVDTFDFSDKHALLEVDCALDATVTIPNFINMIREVTGEPIYRNYYLSRTHKL